MHCIVHVCSFVLIERKEIIIAKREIKKQTILSAYVSYIYIDNFVVKKYFSISLYNTQNTT